MGSMTRPVALIDEVNSRLSAVFSEKRPQLLAISDQLDPVIDQLVAFSAGGKRTRAEFVAAGARMAGAAAADAVHDAVVAAATALELFHAAALIHDDLIDRSDTRRGNPATHRYFRALHEREGWHGDAEHFGASAAILAGDLLLMWSDDLIAQARSAVAPECGQAAVNVFSRMRTEVTAGQYLDVLEEHAWAHAPAATRLQRAITIATSKSARYSVESPLLLGATLAGASERTLATASEIGLPLGLAFQVRDDVLGVFGDAELTGKPAGDDLREGKRTVLIAELHGRIDAQTQAFFDERLGQPDLTPTEITRMQAALRDSGALDAVERRIEQWLADAIAAIERATLCDEDERRLIELAQRTAKRES